MAQHLVVVVHGHPAEVLIDESSRADLLVVASRGHNPLADLLLGSVSARCARRAECPVMVVRPGTGTERARERRTTGAGRAAR